MVNWEKNKCSIKIKKEWQKNMIQADSLITELCKALEQIFKKNLLGV